MKKNQTSEILKHLNETDKRRLLYLKDNVNEFVPWIIGVFTKNYLEFNYNSGNSSYSNYSSILEYLGYKMDEG